METGRIVPHPGGLKRLSAHTLIKECRSLGDSRTLGEAVTCQSDRQAFVDQQAVTTTAITTFGLSSGYDKCQSISARVLKQLVVTVAVVTVCWSCEVCVYICVLCTPCLIRTNCAPCCALIA